VIYSDNLADQDSLVGILYRDLLSFASYVICPCEAMVSFARRWMRGSQQHLVIEDPIQVSRQPFQSL